MRRLDPNIVKKIQGSELEGSKTLDQKMDENTIAVTDYNIEVPKLKLQLSQSLEDREACAKDVYSNLIKKPPINIKVLIIADRERDKQVYLDSTEKSIIEICYLVVDAFFYRHNLSQDPQDSESTKNQDDIQYYPKDLVAKYYSDFKIIKDDDRKIALETEDNIAPDDTTIDLDTIEGDKKWLEREVEYYSGFKDWYNHLSNKNKARIVKEAYTILNIWLMSYISSES